MEKSLSDRVSQFIARLEGKLDAAGILVGSAISEGYAADATARGALPLAVLRPRNTEDVSIILAAASEIGQPIVVQGGRTGLSGASRPLAGEVSLSLERLSGVESIDAAAQTLIAGAGTPLQLVQQAAEDADLYFGVDIGARGTATVGGNIGTNAGGIRVLRYGMYRAQVMGVEAVLADGTILSSLKGLLKDNSGYNLSPLFIGTEGTIGVVTRACLKLHPKPKIERNAFVALPSLAAAQQLLARLRVELSGLLSAFEAIFPNIYEKTVGYMGIRPPVETGAGMYAMIEIQGQSPEQDNERFEAALAQALEDGLATDVVLSNSMRESAALWAIRDGINDFLFSNGVMVGFDISVPLGRMQEFLDTVKPAIQEIDPDNQTYVFGHLGDGNLHYCMFTNAYEKVAEVIFSGIARVGGGVSAEHGIGTDKRRYLKYARSAAEIATMQRMKIAFDPNYILNRGRVFEAPASIVDQPC
ncbi:FAD-binding oxidoreductase [Rhizobium terrae]|uniref:FAD-binding oxidoreductase n=1 Tax=Rhizobium terrae TaxID=2171756 RepID=UPI000E3C8CBF|nr:FAD-binding oxidoreductase [Rhizobium terrae]